MTTRIGSQFPTVSVILPYGKSKAADAIEIYEKSGREAYEWQENVLEPMMAINEDGLWTHMKFGYAIPRQNGKNEVVAMRERDGLEDGERILHTAHRTTTSKAAFNRLIAILEESGLEKDVDFNSIKAIGQEYIKLFASGGEISFRTRSSLGGLGESFDLLVIDEAQEYTDDQESALKYTIAASPNPQTIYTGTPPTPHSSGTVFTNYRNDVLTGKSEDAGWAEWSVEEQSDISDIDLWYQTNPSLGLRITERIIRAEMGDEIDFNIQRLGLWLKYNQKSAITEIEWSQLKAEKLPELKGKLFAGIKYGHDGNNVSLSIAVKTRDNKIFVESIDCRSIRAGNQWIINFLKEADIQEVVIDGANGQEILAEEMKENKLKKPILPTVKEIIVANAKFEQEIYQQTIQHSDQPSLTAIVTNSDKRNIGTSGGFGYQSQVEEHDISLMDSVILAHWACSNAKPVKKQKIGY